MAPFSPFISPPAMLPEVEPCPMLLPEELPEVEPCPMLLPDDEP